MSIYAYMSLIPAYVGVNYFLVLTGKWRNHCSHVHTAHLRSRGLTLTWPVVHTSKSCSLEQNTFFLEIPHLQFSEFSAFHFRVALVWFHQPNTCFKLGHTMKHLWRQCYNFVSPQRKASHLFWDSSELQTEAQCIGIVGRVALKSAFLIRTKKLMLTYPISPNNACAAGWNSLSSISPFRKAEELQRQGNLNAITKLQQMAINHFNM